MAEDSTLKKKNRDKFEVWYDMLKVLADGGLGKTRIMHMAILSFDQLKEHLTALDKLQLITNDGDGMIYLSDKGEAFMKKYERLCKIFDTRKIEN